MATPTDLVENPREALLTKANTLINGDRNRDYDDPEDNFQRIADFWNAYLVGIGDRDLEPHDVALLNILQKIARLQHTTDHADSWVDIAGYAACGWDTIVAKSLRTPEDDPGPEDGAPMLRVVEYPARPASIRDEILIVRYPVTGENGRALFFTGNDNFTNADQVAEFLGSDGDRFNGLDMSGYWFVRMFDPAYGVQAMDPETFKRQYTVVAPSVVNAASVPATA